MDRILEKIDANVGPPMVDARSFLVHGASCGVDLHRLAPVAPTLDQLVHFFVNAERKYATRHSPSATPSRISVADLIVDSSLVVSEMTIEAVAPQRMDVNAEAQYVVVAA